MMTWDQNQKVTLQCLLYLKMLRRLGFCLSIDCFLTILIETRNLSQGGSSRGYMPTCPHGPFILGLRHYNNLVRTTISITRCSNNLQSVSASHLTQNSEIPRGTLRSASPIVMISFCNAADSRFALFSRSTLHIFSTQLEFSCI
jgi:hypothetical protein